MRWLVGAGSMVVMMIAACGPELPDAGSDARGSSSGEGAPASAGSTTTASATGPDDSGPGPDADTHEATSTGTEPPPEFLGQWICDGYSEPIFLTVDTYEPVNQPTGQACFADGGGGPPPSWARCAELSPHPVGGLFWVLLDFGDELRLNLNLIHDLALDVLDGTIMTFDSTIDGPAHCERYRG